MNNRGVLTILSDFGCWKRNTGKRTFKKYDNYALSVSATTRSARPERKMEKLFLFICAEFEKNSE